MTKAPSSALSPNSSGYVDVGELELYCERHGEGPPLVLLHGAFGTIESCFERLLPILARDFELIAVELQAHGRTRDVPRPLSYTTMAGDIASLLETLGVPRAHLVGYSMGGAVAMQLALDRPELVDRVVYAGGASFDLSGIHPQLAATFEAFDLHALDDTRWHRDYRRVAPDPDAWWQLVTKVNELDRYGEPSWPRQRLAALRAPTLLIVGDCDVVRLEHVVEMFHPLAGDPPGGPAEKPPAQLAVLPGTTHEGMLDRVDWLASMIAGFIGGDLQRSAGR